MPIPYDKNCTSLKKSTTATATKTAGGGRGCCLSSLFVAVQSAAVVLRNMPKIPRSPKRTDLKPAPYNPRRIEPAALTGLQTSVERFGDISGIVWNSRSGHVVSGHQRIQALEARGAVYQDSPPAFLLGDRVFPVRVVDWDEPTEKAANLTANNPAIGGEWTEGLQDLLDDLAGFEGFDDLRLGDLENLAEDFKEDLSDGQQENNYSRKICAPIYSPTGDCPAVSALTDKTRTLTLMNEIEKSNVSSEVASFLKDAAHRHTVFSFSKIAEYYAHAGPEVQRLMENSALIIIDFDKAIEHGFVKLTEAIAAQYSKDYPDNDA